VTHWLSKVSNRLGVVKRDDVRLSLATLQLDCRTLSKDPWRDAPYFENCLRAFTDMNSFLLLVWRTNSRSLSKHFRYARYAVGDIVVGVVTRLRVGLSGVQFPARVKYFLALRSDRPWGSLSLLFNKYQGSFPCDKVGGARN